MSAHRPYDQEYSADRILDGDLPRRRPSPAVQVAEDVSGFARVRLFHVPEAGTHPRVLFGPEDVPAIRTRLGETDCGRQIMDYAREQLTAGIDGDGTWENLLFTRLENGDVAGFAQAFREKDGALPTPGNSAPSAQALPGTKWHHRDPFLVGLMLKAFCCLLDGDEKEGRRIGSALAAYTRFLEPLVLTAAAGVSGDDYWRGARRVVGDHAEFAYAYDWAHGFMTPEQRGQVRRVISTITRGRYVLGMGMPSHWRNWNWIGIGQYFTLMALAIEGEEGYDPRIYARSTEVVRDFLTYGIDAAGVGAESIGYHTAGMTHLSAVMIAMANRGDNFFTHAHYRRQLDRWMPWTLQPQGGTWINDGDLGDFPPAVEPLMVAKFFFPDDPALDYVYQNLPAVRANDFRRDFFLETMLLCPADPRRDAAGGPADYRAGAALGLPLTFHDPERGLLIARSAWAADALDLQFLCRPDTVMATHDHADRGRFTLSALGRAWVREDSRLIETQDHSGVLIDGVGQGYFPPPGRWLGCADSPAATFGACDAKYAYAWRWEKEILMWDRDDPRLEMPYYRNYRPKIEAFDRRLAEYDPSPAVAAYYRDYLDGNPLMWSEDSWVIRLPHNPVLKAFRAAGLVRGASPYALIVDDIQKDSDAHRYDWLMALPGDIIEVGQSEAEGSQDLILGDELTDRRLLVRVLQADGAGPMPFLETYEAGGRGLRPQRLVVSRYGIAPAFKVLLCPHRRGERLPMTRLDRTDARLTVSWPGQEDVFAFGRGGEASAAALTLTRDGVTVLAL